MILPTALLLISLVHVAFSECNVKCPLIYAPVCGTDGNTYSNECFLKAEKECKGNPQLDIAHKGSCYRNIMKRETEESFQCEPQMKSGICTSEYFPICGSDGKTYGNKCIFCYNLFKMEEQGSTLKMNHFGECQPDDYCPPYSKKGICTLEYSPVCANDGKTYPTICSMCAAMYKQQQAGNNVILKVVSNGVCKEAKIALSEPVCNPKFNSGICTLEYFPMCGSDGKTYGNKCTFCYAKFIKQENGEDLTLNHVGECEAAYPLQASSVKCVESDKSGICTEEYLPICGSDGKTYSNRCDFCYNMYKMEEHGVSLTVKHSGECQPDDYCPAHSKKGICTLEYSPVCANDGKTYPTICSMCAAMYKQQQAGNNVILKVVSNGVCKEAKIALSEPVCNPKFNSGICTLEYFPMCGSDGKTYGNKCTFCYAKFIKQENGEDLTLNHVGECEAAYPLQASSVKCKESDKSGICTNEYFPICGSDGKTYGNRCDFCFAKYKEEENGNELTVDHIGVCSRELKCPEISRKGACPFIYAPVCSNEGKTYSSECLLCVDLYKRQANGENIHLHISHDGKC